MVLLLEGVNVSHMLSTQAHTHRCVCASVCASYLSNTYRLNKKSTELNPPRRHRGLASLGNVLFTDKKMGDGASACHEYCNLPVQLLVCSQPSKVYLRDDSSSQSQSWGLYYALCYEYSHHRLTENGPLY